MIGIVAPTLVSVPESSRVARVARGGAEVRSSEGLDERHVAEYVSGAWAQVVMEVPVGSWAVGGAGNKPGVPPLAAGEEAQAAYKFSKNFSGVIMAALYETTESIAAEGVRDLVAFLCMTESACPGLSEEGERSEAQAHAGRIQKRLGVKADGAGIGDGDEPHTSRSGGDAVQEGAGPVRGQKAHQHSVVGVVEGAACQCGQLSELGGSWCGDFGCGMGSEIREAAVNLPPGRKCVSMGGCEGVQVDVGRLTTVRQRQIQGWFRACN
jgi:hypothetical protein